MKIALHDYSPEWPRRFAAERRRLLAVLPPGALVEHIGSTSVPGLAAKDIIDLMIGLPDFDAQAADVVPRIVALGYVYVSRHEAVMPFRRFLYRDENEVRRCHIHMVGTGTPFWVDHLLFRDHLRAEAPARLDYEALKRDLAAREWADKNDYTDAKGPFIQAAVAAARLSRPAPPG